jgi:hypothetical protein
MMPLTKSLVSLLKQHKIIRLKKKTSRISSRHLDGVLDELREFARKDKNLRCLESEEPEEMILLYDINHKIDSYLI